MLGAFCPTNFSHNHDKKKSFKSSREEIGLRGFKELLGAEARRCSREEQDKQEANLGDFWECRGFATGEWLRKEWCSYRLRDIWMVFLPRVQTASFVVRVIRVWVPSRILAGPAGVSCEALQMNNKRLWRINWWRALLRGSSAVLLGVSPGAGIYISKGCGDGHGESAQSQVHERDCELEVYLPGI